MRASARANSSSERATRIPSVFFFEERPGVLRVGHKTRHLTQCGTRSTRQPAGSSCRRKERIMNEIERFTPAHGWKMLAALTLLGAAAIHVAVTPQHFDEWFAAGVFFIVLAVAEIVGGAVMISPVGERPAARGLVAALTAATIALWVVSRTVGLPFGPDPGMPEAIGVLDLPSPGLEAPRRFA